MSDLHTARNLGVFSRCTPFLCSLGLSLLNVLVCKFCINSLSVTPKKNQREMQKIDERVVLAMNSCTRLNILPWLSFVFYRKALYRPEMTYLNRPVVVCPSESETETESIGHLFIICPLSSITLRCKLCI